MKSLPLTLAAFHNLKNFIERDRNQLIERSLLELQESVDREAELQERLLLIHFSEILESGTVEFAATKFFGGSKKKAKNCTKGWACGYTCLSRKVKNCKKTLEGQFKTLAEFLKAQEKPASKKASPSPKKLPADHTVTVNPRIKPNSLDDALDSIPTEGAAERVALLREFVKNSGVQAVFYDKGQSEKQAKTLAQSVNYKHYTTSPGYEDSIDNLPPGIQKGSQEYKDALTEACLKPYKNSYGYTAMNLKHVVVITDSGEGLVKIGMDFKPNAKELGGVVNKAISDKDRHSLSRSADNSDSQNLITYIHEMGHQVHFRAGIPAPPKEVKHLTQYSKKNNLEWFAEHFAAWTLDAKSYSQFDPVGAKFIESTVKKASKK